MGTPLMFAWALLLAGPSRGMGLSAQGWDPVSAGTHEVAHLRTRELVTGGAGVNDPLPLVIVLHGRAAGADGFMRRFFGLGVRARVVAIEAPRRVPHDGGFAWLSQRAKDAPPAQVARELAEAAAAVSAEIEALVADRPTVGAPIVVGYSQGGMVALALAAARPDSVGDVIAAASFLPPELAPHLLAGGPVPRVRMVHGRADLVVPHQEARATRDRLLDAAWDVELHTVRRGHQLDTTGWGRVILELRRAVLARA